MNPNDTRNDTHTYPAGYVATPEAGEKWAVVCAGQSPKQFKAWHPTIESARAEAERLCKQTRQKFYVIQAVAVVETAEPPIKYTEI